jgi:hypothetical protein
LIGTFDAAVTLNLRSCIKFDQMSANHLSCGGFQPNNRFCRADWKGCHFFIGAIAMGRRSWFSRLYWTKFAKPVEQRALYQFLINHPISSVLEIGVGSGQRMQRICQLVNLVPGVEQLRYIGVDEFESSTSGEHLTLKEAHRIASQLGFKASLIPGTIQSAVPRVAHKFGPSDLIIVDGGIDLDRPTSGPVGGWLNRLAHSRSTVIASGTQAGPMVILPTQSLDLPIVKAA